MPTFGELLFPSSPPENAAPVDPTIRTRAIIRLRDVAALRQLSYLLWAVAWIITIPFVLAVSLNTVNSSDDQLLELWILAVVPFLGGAIAGGLAYMHWSETVPYLCTSAGVSWSADDSRRTSQGFAWASWIVGGMALMVAWLDIDDIGCLDCYRSNVSTILGVVVGLICLFVLLRMFHQVTQTHCVYLGARDLASDRSLLPTMFSSPDWTIGSFLVPLNPGILWIIAILLVSSTNASTSGYDIPTAIAGIIGLASVLGSIICFFQYWELNRRCRIWLRGQRSEPYGYGYVSRPPAYPPAGGFAPPAPPPPPPNPPVT